MNIFLFMVILSSAAFATLKWMHRKGSAKDISEEDEERPAKHGANGTAQMLSGAESDDNPEISGQSEITSNEPPIGTGRKQTEPGNRTGGKYSNSKDEPTQPRQNTRKFRLVCFKDNERFWQIAVELPEEFEESKITVEHNGTPLEAMSHNEKRWKLKHINGCVVAKSSEGDERICEIQLSLDALLFKLDKEGEKGRHVKKATFGEYFLLTPSSWNCNDKSINQEHNVSPEDCTGWTFRRNDNDPITTTVFTTSDNTIKSITCYPECSTLEGKRIKYTYGDYNAPFFSEPPTLTFRNIESIHQIAQVILGSVRSDEKPWRKSIIPVAGNDKISLSDIRERKEGWFFVRLYDRDDMLIEAGLYFFYSPSLKDIIISESTLLPNETGHKAARIEFHHEQDTNIKIFEDGHVQPIPPPDGITTYQIKPKCEIVCWELSSHGYANLKGSTYIERVWWATGREDVIPSDTDWTDKPITVKLSDFFANSDKVLWARLPCTGSINSLFAGFTRDTARPYNAPAENRAVPIPLREFSASSQVEAVGVAPLYIWVKENAREVSVAVLRLEIVYECLFCQMQFCSDDQAIAHAINHEREFRRNLSYDELRERFPELPRAIYKCSHCELYVRADEKGGDPTNTIIHHITENHKQHGIPAAIHFRVVSDFDEIKKIVGENMPTVFRCTECNEIFEDDLECFADHIFRKHKHKLYNLV